MGASKPPVPFAYRNKQDFPSRLVEWIGQVFYDLLPEHGYEIREEQIYTAFQLAEAVCQGKVHFAEAGLGTGKTFAYLLTAVAYARFKGWPVIIACASTALQEQLAGPRGDIEKLSRMLGLGIDARMAKDPRQYLCDQKMNQSHNPFCTEPDDALTGLLQWVEKTGRGERSEMPGVPDRVWAQVAWDEAMSCETCLSRGFCKLVQVRRHYRAARDLIVCDHGIFFDDLWTRDQRQADGKLPLLPEYAAVVLDEGHQVLLPAALRAGRKVVREDIDAMLLAIERAQGVRTSLLAATVAVDAASTGFFQLLDQATGQDEGSERLTVRVSQELLQAAELLGRALGVLHFELLSEQELHSQSTAHLPIPVYEAGVEQATQALGRFCRHQGQDVVVWVNRVDRSFWVVPRDITGMLHQYLWSGKLPVVFSSATISNGGDFSYFARTLGVQNPSGSSVDSAFDFEEQVMVYLPKPEANGDARDWLDRALEQLVVLLRRAGGRALVLARTPRDVQQIRLGLEEYRLPFELLWEDAGERGYLVRRFRAETSSVLVGSGFWEGIDVPGGALSLLVIWQLPFPPRDPLLEARRNDARVQGLNPVTAVDYPEMALRLKQGCGRLIRTGSDRGVIAILAPVLGQPWEQQVRGALPPGAKIVHDPGDITMLAPDLVSRSDSVCPAGRERTLTNGPVL